MGGQEAAAQCVVDEGAFFDDYVPGGDNRDRVGAERMFSVQVVRHNGRPSLLAAVGNAAVAYDISTGTPASKTSGSFMSSNVYPHNHYRLRGMAVIDDFPYGFAAYSSEGWALFKMVTDGSGRITKLEGMETFNFSILQDASDWIYGGALFRSGGRVYAVASYLDKISGSVQIADMGDGSSDPPLTKMSKLDAKSSSAIFEVVEGSGGPYIYQFGSAGLHIYNVSDPSSPSYVGLFDDAGLKLSVMAGRDYGPSYPRGTALAPAYDRLYTLAGDGNFYIYDVSNPVNPVRKGAFSVGNSGDGLGIASDGRMVAVVMPKVNGGPRVRYYSVGGDVVTEIPGGPLWDAAYDEAYEWEQAADVALLPGAPDYHVYHCNKIRSYYESVSAGCLDSTPRAGVGAVRSTGSGTPTCSPATGHVIAAKGFPGDGFTVSNLSSGFPSPTVDSVVVTGIDSTAGNTGYSQVLTQSGGVWPWVSPNTMWGEFAVTLTINGGADAATAYIYLCTDPAVSVQITEKKPFGGSWEPCDGCGWLAGDALRLSALQSAGWPTWSATTWQVEHRPTGGGWEAAAPGDYVDNGDGTLDLTLNQTGDYRATASLTYPFDPGTPRQGTSQDIHSGEVTAVIVVKQAGTTINNGGSVLSTLPIDVEWSGVVGGGQTPAYAWSSPQAGGWSCSTASCSIPAGTLPLGTAQVDLTVTTANDQASDTKYFQVVQLNSNFSWTPTSPAVGQEVTFELTQVTPGLDAVRLMFPEAGCDPQRDAAEQWFCLGTCEAGLTLPFHFAISGTKTVILEGKASGGDWTEFRRGTVTVSSGTCDDTCTAPSAPSLTSPANGATGQASALTLYWSAPSSGDGPFTYTVYLDGSARCSSTSSTNCYVSSLSAGSHSWNVRAWNACGSHNTSSTRTFTVGTTPPPTATGSFAVSTTSPQIGQQVTFTVSSISGADTVRFLLTEADCDGKLEEWVCWQSCSPGLSSTFRFANSGNKTVYMQGYVSGDWHTLQARSLTVASTGSCAACEAPQAASLVSPAHGAIGVGSATTLEWAAPISGSPPFTFTAVVDGFPSPGCSGISSTSCYVPALSNGPHSWSVTTTNPCGQSNSAEWSFNTCGATAPPVPNFTWAPQGDVLLADGVSVRREPFVGQTVQFTDQTAGSPSEWQWYDFGNEVAPPGLTQQNPTYTFNAAGAMNVLLRTSNCYGMNTADALGIVTVYPDDYPVIAEFAPTPLTPTAGQQASFIAGSGGSYGSPGIYTWSFPDNSVAAQSYGGALTATTKLGNPVVHTFGCPGEYDVTLTVTRTRFGGGQVTDTKTMRITVGGEPCCDAQAPPVPNFTWQPMDDLVMANGFVQKQPYVGQTVQFADLSTNMPTSWQWYDFGGDVPLPGILGQNPTYVFERAEVMKVRLKTGNCRGSNVTDAWKDVTIFADERPVIAHFTWAPAPATTGTPTSFSGGLGPPYGDPETFQWDFGDGGATASGEVTNYTYQCAGSYQVTLTVTGRGQTDAVTKTVTVGGTQCCDAPGAPVADLTWAPQGPLAGYPAQQQPFVGQPVAFTDASSNSPTEWFWWDFHNDPEAGLSYTTQNITHTFVRAGNHNVRMWSKNCAGKSIPAAFKVVTVYADVRPVVPQFTCTPMPIQTGVETTCTAVSGFDVGAPTSFTFAWGDDGTTSPGPVATHTFECRGSHDVTLTVGKKGVDSASLTRSFQVDGFQCCEPPGPVTSPQPAASTWTAGGTLVLAWQPPNQGTGPFTYDVVLDSVIRCSETTATQCVINDYPETAKTHRWSVIAKNACGSTDTTGVVPEWTFRACSAPGVATAAFDWEPTGPMPNFPDQQQPYVGQSVTFYDRSTNQPTEWKWYDFQNDPQEDIIYTTQNATHTFSGAGKKNVRLRVSNCTGTPTGVLQPVIVYEDVRPVIAEFDYLPEQPQALQPVTFFADDSSSYGDPNQFTWIFDDGTPPQTGKEMTHVFACGRSYKVTLTAKRVKGRTTKSATVTRNIQVNANGRPCSPDALLLIDLTARIPPQGEAGIGGDMTMYNASPEDMVLDLLVRPGETGEVATVQLPLLLPAGTLTLHELLAGGEFASDAATVWIRRSDGGTALPVVSARNYSQTATGETYSQFLPVFQVWPGESNDTTQWLTGLIHNGNQVPNGFLTYLTIVNPLPTPWTSNVGVTLYRLNGERIGSLGVGLPAYGYRKMLLPYYLGIDNKVDLGPVTVKINVPAGQAVVVTASMVHNTSASAIVIPSQTVP